MKNIFKGTKGKWEACNRTNHVQTYTVMNGREIPGLQTICSVNTTFISEEKAKANAKLISKSPELLESAQDFVREFEGDYVLDGLIVDNPDTILVKNYIVFKKLVKEATGV